MSRAVKETLRDKFAGNALVGLLSEPFVKGVPGTAWQVNGRPCESGPVADYYAEAAYKLADAMLRAREVQS